VKGIASGVEIVRMKPSPEGLSPARPFILQDGVPRYVANLAFDENAGAPMPLWTEPKTLGFTQGSRVRSRAPQGVPEGVIASEGNDISQRRH
jgi:hypothetical protein